MEFKPVKPKLLILCELPFNNKLTLHNFAKNMNVLKTSQFVYPEKDLEAVVLFPYSIDFLYGLLVGVVY